MTWRELVAKVLWLVGLAGYPALLVKVVHLSLGKALLGGAALAFATPLLFLLAASLLDRPAAPDRKPAARPPPPGPRP